MTGLKILLISLVYLIMFSAGYFTRRSEEKPVKTFYDSVTNYAIKSKIYRQTVDYQLICDFVETNAKAFDIDRNLIMAFIIKESEICPTAININTNKKGKMTIDKGLCQVNTIYDDIVFGTNCPFDVQFRPDVNIQAGCYVLRDKLNIFKTKEGYDYFKSFHGYNGIAKHNLDYPKDILRIYIKLNKICNEVE